MNRWMKGLSLALLTLAGGAQAALNDLGNGLVYDTTLKFYWLKDANLVKTLCDANAPLWQSWPEPNPAVAGNSGRTKAQICTDNGRLDWYESEAWISHLNSNSYLGYNDWRQPTTKQPDATCSYTDSNSQNYGYRCEGSELGHLFNVALNNPNELDNNCYNPPGTSPNHCLLNRGPFDNFQTNQYWSGTEYAPFRGLVWYFETSDGRQGHTVKVPDFLGGSYSHVWPVRLSVATAPPSTTHPTALPTMGIWGFGLLGLFLTWMARRRLG